ncbi:MAG: LEA type 2 family protein [Desulfobacterales bacterium]|nr:LEA type 2 family protein [Desulfobacterales bacterium]
MIPNRFAARLLAAILILAAALMSGSCASLTQGYESPTVSVSSFRALPGDGIAPRFEIGLHIVNPNRIPLELQGVAYTISIEDHKILTGVSNTLPVIDAYGEGEVTLYGSVNFFSGISLFTSLIRNQPENGLSYDLEAKLDVGALHPVIRINKTGKLTFDAPR